MLADILVERGKTAALRLAAREDTGTPAADIQGRLLWPALVDMHTHIDKSQVISRIGPLGASFTNAREAISADRRKHWTRDDIRARMDFSIRCAYVHGTAAIRSHIDSYEGQAEASWDVFAELHRAWKGRVALQATSSVPIDVYATPYGVKLADMAAATEGGLLGGVLRRSTDHNYIFINNIDALLDMQFALAKERGLNIDLHVDETTVTEVFHLEAVARAVIRNDMHGRVVCSHCCSLSVQPDETIETALALCAEAGVGIVTLPLANVYLQDRGLNRTPRLRGVTAVHEIRAHNVPLAMGSDNVRDSFYPYGDYDLVDTFRQAVGIYHLDQCLTDSLGMLGPMPARLMGVEPLGSLATGGPANFLILDARSVTDLVCRPPAWRIVVSNGREVTEELPEFPS